MTVEIVRGDDIEVVECDWARVIEDSGCFLIGFRYPGTESTYVGRAFAPGVWTEVTANENQDMRVTLAPVKR